MYSRVWLIDGKMGTRVACVLWSSQRVRFDLRSLPLVAVRAAKHSANHVQEKSWSHHASFGPDKFEESCLSFIA